MTTTDLLGLILTIAGIILFYKLCNIYNHENIENR